MAKKKFTTTKEDFEKFKAECEKWIKVYGLSDYDISFKHQDENGYIANCKWDIEAHWATMGLSKNFDETEPTDWEIRSSAYHEVVELLLAEFYTKASWRYNVSQSALDAARHAIVQRLMNAHFKKEYSKNGE